MKERAGKKRVVLELGGNAGVIVDAIGGSGLGGQARLVGAFSYAGQVCISVQRMFIHEPIYDGFLERFVDGAKAARGGRSARPGDAARPDGRRAAQAQRTESWVARPRRWAARC